MSRTVTLAGLRASVAGACSGVAQPARSVSFEFDLPAPDQPADESGLLPRTPAGRMEFLNDLYAPSVEQEDGSYKRDPSHGVISLEQFRRLMGADELDGSDAHVCSECRASAPDKINGRCLPCHRKIYSGGALTAYETWKRDTDEALRRAGAAVSEQMLKAAEVKAESGSNLPPLDKRHGFDAEMARRQAAMGRGQNQLHSRGQLGALDGIALDNQRQMEQARHAQQGIAARATNWGRELQRVDEPPLTAETLARALYAVDPEVQSHVGRVADAALGATYDPARHQRALDKAWELDQPDNARTRWTQRAEAALAWMRRAK